MSRPTNPPKANRKAVALKPIPPKAMPLTLAHVAAPLGASTLQRVTHCISAYTQVDPIGPSAQVGTLCKTLDFLGADLNVEFHLQGHQQYWQDEIESQWTVRYLSDYTDVKIQQAP